MQNKFDKRIEKLTQELRNCDIFKALITNSSNIFYLTGIEIVTDERFAGLLVDLQHNKIQIIMPELEKGKIVNNKILGQFYRDHEDPIRLLTNNLGKCNVLGVEKCFINLLRAETLKGYIEKKEKSQCDLVDIGSILNIMRLHKEESEIENIKLSANYIDEILNRVKNKINVGMTEKQIKFMLLEEISLKKDVAGPVSGIIVSSGLNASNPHGKTENKKILKGDLLLIDCGVNFRHYKSDMSRTFFIGEPEKELQKIYCVVLEAQKRAIEKVYPGVCIKELDITARKVIEEAGYGKYFPHRLGHGIGLDIHELPSIHNLNEGILEEGMVFTIEPGIYIPDLGGVRIEDEIIVTKEGKQVLTNSPKEFKDIVIY